MSILMDVCRVEGIRFSYYLVRPLFLDEKTSKFLILSPCFKETQNSPVVEYNLLKSIPKNHGSKYNVK